jgi:hypothetical protein
MYKELNRIAEAIEHNGLLLEKIVACQEKILEHRLTKQEKYIQQQQKLQEDMTRIRTPIEKFIEAKCVLGSNCTIEREILYKAHSLWCIENNICQENNVWFSRRILSIGNITKYRPTINGVQTSCYRGIKLYVQETM